MPDPNAATDPDLAPVVAQLQSAVALEHATLPLYLSAMFSLEVQNYTTYNLIRSVVMEEMVIWPSPVTSLLPWACNPRSRR